MTRIDRRPKTKGPRFEQSRWLSERCEESYASEKLKGKLLKAAKRTCQHRKLAAELLHRISLAAMKRLPLLLVLAFTLSVLAAPQSGRRITTTTRTTATAPVQPPLNPEPEPKAPTSEASTLLFLPERLLEHPIKTLDDNSFRLSDFQGKVLVINIWASWCGPCRMEIPDYEKVRKQYLDRGVEFIGLTTEDPRAGTKRINKFVQETGFAFLLGWADRETAHILMSGDPGIPQTLVIDRRGSVVNHWSGYARRHSIDRLTNAIENALK